MPQWNGWMNATGATTYFAPVTYTYSSSSTANHTWAWIGSMTSTMVTTTSTLTPPPLDPALVEQHRQDVERRRQDTDRRVEARRVAEARAEELLTLLLPADQHDTYRLNGTFEVIGSNGNRYRIRRGVSGNIDYLDEEGKVAGRLCAHPDMRTDHLPTADVMLAQFLALTTDEAAFLRVANVHQGRRPAAPTPVRV